MFIWKKLSKIQGNFTEFETSKLNKLWTKKKIKNKNNAYLYLISLYNSNSCLRPISSFLLFEIKQIIAFAKICEFKTLEKIHKNLICLNAWITQCFQTNIWKVLTRMFASFLVLNNTKMFAYERQIFDF